MSKPLAKVQPIPVDPAKRRSMSAGDLTGQDLEEIARAEIPAADRYTVQDLDR